jgi:hypothetical protein
MAPGPAADARLHRLGAPIQPWRGVGEPLGEFQRHGGHVHRPRPPVSKTSPAQRPADSVDAAFECPLHKTHALEPLERTSQWETGELPATYPYGV